MTNSINKWKKRTLRGSKEITPKRGYSDEQIKEQLNTVLELNGQRIFEFAKTAYQEAGRGLVNLVVKEHPDNPFKLNTFYYQTEADNSRTLSFQSMITDDDRRIAEVLSTYEPSSQAVILIWYGTQYQLRVATAPSVVLHVSAEKALAVH